MSKLFIRNISYKLFFRDTEDDSIIIHMRYRGYYLDEETSYYYLQSRCYDPQWKRFLNSDDFDFLLYKKY